MTMAQPVSFGKVAKIIRAHFPSEVFSYKTPLVETLQKLGNSKTKAPFSSLMTTACNHRHGWQKNFSYDEARTSSPCKLTF